jgi:flagellar basal-body rod protein FlgF
MNNNLFAVIPLLIGSIFWWALCFESVGTVPAYYFGQAPSGDIKKTGAVIMDSSVYIVLSRQLAQFRDMEISANNIANTNTPGYSAQKLVFSQYMVDNGKTGKKDAYADAAYDYRDTTGGAIQNTGNPLDLAISGKGYFQVETPLGTRYTKSGSFQVSSEGTLVNVNGYPVLGNDNSQISIPLGSRTIEINALGQIKANGQTAGQVGVVEFQNEQALNRRGNSLYEAAETPQPAQTARVLQGAIEASNVNGVTELVRVMELSRSFASSSKFIETIYDLERKTSSTLSRSKQS